MKKILLITPVIICLIFSSMIILPFTAYSADAGSLAYYPLSSFQEDKNFNADTDLFFYAQFTRGGGTNYTYGMYLQFHEDDVNSVDCTDGVYTIIFNSNIPGLCVANVASNPGDTYFGSPTSFSCKRIVLDTNSNTCYGYDASNYKTMPYYAECGFYSFQTNIFDEKTTIPDVTVEFTPVLSGEVDRTVINSNGTNSLLQDLQMHVRNYSSFPVQYNMKIFLANPLSNRDFSFVDDSFDSEDSDLFISNQKDWINTHYDDDPVFVYYSNTQVYEGMHTSYSRIPDEDNPMLYNKASEWHKVEANSGDIVTFPLSMINLEQGVEYVVSVECYRLDLNYVCDIVRPSDCPTAHVDVETYCRPYYETFKFLSYSDIVYNPNQTSGNILPFDGSSGIAQNFGYQYDYDAVTDPVTGDQKIGHYDYIKDPDSWVNNSNIVSFYKPDPFDFSDVSVTSFSGMFSNVFGFVSMFMNYLPSQIMSIFIFGFSCIVVIAIIKAVR